MTALPCTTRRRDLPERWRDQLFAILDRQGVLCASLQQCSQRQNELIRADRVESLVSLLSHRQGLIDELVDIGASLEPFRAAWPDLWPQLPADDQARVSGLLARMDAMVADIMANDARDRSAVETERDRLRLELGRMNTARAANRVYHGEDRQGARSARGARFMDEQG